VRALVRVAASLVLVALLGCVLLMSRTVSPSRIDRAPAAVADVAADGPKLHRARPDGTESVVDLYGNEVDEAIATYSLDPTGSLYEVHSPQTELPRLASPKS
jgi:hypothetical protein